ncbi:carboxypeptidase-like regulatory domain-containing protein [Chitinophaga pinensis]|uniref:Carboxypeptidase-like regulatory domain-containing protein n=1 Tax=Chitinophaga pinensis TaxID=79329 RepID=A0A5C6LY12_9BACT|nr:carboxypeptidase-like regulatory domain-containing protein [Chitinophaga pinensis]TWW02101.1 carboxypeptidase-like regulatory domain-containing protein [Chitinophaga pinensis]
MAGNVFWKYNDYVGNKPDAGATVALYSTKDTIKHKATCDVNGNFKFDKINVGNYILVVTSKSTNASPKDHLQNIIDHFAEVNYVTKHDLSKLNFTAHFNTLRDSIRALLVKDVSATHDYVNLINQRKEMEDSLSSFSSRILFDIYQQSPAATVPRSLSNKFYYSTITVEPEKTNNVAIDFGITYN